MGVINGLFESIHLYVRHGLGEPSLPTQTLGHGTTKYHLTKYGGSFIEYEYLTGRSPFDVENDYKILIPKTSRGLTKVGQKLFQQSIEAFVYFVLGAQAKTRWSITGQGAKNLQTQEVFRKVVRDTIVHDDVTVTISNMRTAMTNTHVILNFAIMPGLILIPSDMRILIKPIPGFSNFF
jgi:hypothetical protein